MSSTYSKTVIEINNGVVFVETLEGRKYQLENSKFCTACNVRVGDKVLIERRVSIEHNIKHYLVGVLTQNEPVIEEQKTLGAYEHV